MKNTKPLNQNETARLAQLLDRFINSNAEAMKGLVRNTRTPKDKLCTLCVCAEVLSSAAFTLRWIKEGKIT